MKIIVNWLIVVMLLVSSILALNCNLNYSNLLINSKQEIWCKNKESKDNCINKSNMNSIVEYQQGSMHTDLILGLVSKECHSNTRGATIIAAKSKDFISYPSVLKIKINDNVIDLKSSYYVLGNINYYNKCFYATSPSGQLSKNFIINTDGIYQLHLVDNFGNGFDSYLELGEKYWELNCFFEKEQLNKLCSRLNVNSNLDFTFKEEEELSIWLSNYQFDADTIFLKSINNYSKGFNIYISDLPNRYKSFLDPIEYNKKNHNENINFFKLDSSVKNIANYFLQKNLNIAENKVDMHGYTIKQILDNKQLPQNKSEINNYDNGKSFSQWLQMAVNIKFYYWQLKIKIMITVVILLLLLLVLLISLYVRYKKIYQPSFLREFRLAKKQMNIFQYKKLIFSIYQFIKLNSKIDKYYFWKKNKVNNFLLIQEIIKDNLESIDYTKYDNIFYHKKEKSFLEGKHFISILLNCDSAIKYNKIIRMHYPNCRSSKLHKILLNDILEFYINQVKNSKILELEKNFDITTKMQLAKIRSFLKKQEWNYYFFELQNLSHVSIIKFLNWKDKPLNFSSYGKLLKRKLFWILKSEEKVEEYLQIIQTINFYRNLLSKVSPVKQNKLFQWNQLDNKSKEDLGWDIYFSLIKFIDFVNKYSQK